MSKQNPFNEQNPYGSPSGNVPMGNPKNYNPNDRDSTGGIIPYKNPHALIGYYLGIISCIIPVLGLLGGIAAVILGIMGLIKRNKNPNIKGSIHAIVAICFGFVAIFIQGICTIAILAPLLSGNF